MILAVCYGYYTSTKSKALADEPRLCVMRKCEGATLVMVGAINVEDISMEHSGQALKGVGA